jgi:hypothetical protein
MGFHQCRGNGAKKARHLAICAVSSPDETRQASEIRLDFVSHICHDVLRDIYSMSDSNCESDKEVQIAGSALTKADNL